MKRNTESSFTALAARIRACADWCDLGVRLQYPNDDQLLISLLF